MTRRARQTLTVTDLFCGAGGSSIGAIAAGAELRMAANHWQLAIETHSANFPDADHDCADVSQVDPRRYPTTDILLASPECTHHSQARSKKHEPNLFNPHGDPAAERSRATMWDVPRFAERHRYAIVIVENVVEVRRWAPFTAWLGAMDSLGYEHELVYLNSLVAHPTPQSRDRIYVVFWRHGNRKPDLDFRPACWCQECGDVDGVQAWKRPERPGGKYKSQYVYRGARCNHVVYPYAWPAASAIDWTLPCPRIGDRERPLADATLRRIEIGLDRYVRPFFVKNYGNAGEAKYRSHPVSSPLGAVTASDSHGLVVPVHHPERGPGARPVSAPWPSQTGRQEHALVVDAAHSGDDNCRVHDPSEPFTTVHAGGNKHALVAVPFLVSRYDYAGADGSRVWPVDDPSPTLTANATQHALVVPLRRNGKATPASDAPVPTVEAGGNHHALVVKNYGDGRDPSMTKPVTSPFGTVTSVDHHALLDVPFTVDYHGNGQANPVDRPLPTQDTRDRHALVEPSIEVDDCGFRMLEPHEIGRAMAFPDTYVVLGNKRQRVRQFGNAVTPPVMSLLLERAIASLR